MRKIKSRFLSLLLASVMLLTFALPASAYAPPSEITNVTDYGDTSSTESSMPQEENSSSEESSSGAESSAPAEEENSTPQTESSSSTEEKVEPPLQDSGIPPDSFTFDAQIVSRSRASGVITVNMKTEPNIPFKYPFSGGTSTFASYIYWTSDGQLAYCIEPSRMDSNHGTVITGSLTFGGLSLEKQQAIARVIAANTASYTDHESYMAAQALIWEIAMGQAHKSGSVYSAVVVPNAAKLAAPYESILKKYQTMGEIPSFMSKDKANPTLHQLKENGGKYTLDLKNTNGKVSLNAANFKSQSQLKFSASGSTLTVSSDSEPGADSFTTWESLPGQSGMIFWNSSEQTKASITSPSTVPVNGYMKFSADALVPELPDEGDEKQGLGYLNIYKFDGKTNLPLGGAIFKVECEGFRDDGFSVPYGGGTVVIPIPKGKDFVEVTVTEITSPDGYVKDPDSKKVTVTAGDTINLAEVSFVNYPADCSLTIYKHERGKKGVALAGARFRIRYADPDVSAKVWTETTDANGEIHIALPSSGTLIIEELEAPAGYVMGAITTHDVTVAKGEDKHIDISNDKKSELVAIKKDAQTGQLLAGAIIRATLLRSNTEPHEGGQVYTQTTGADGRAVFQNLIPGEYRVEEIQPPQYYVLNDTTVHTVNVLDGNSAVVEVEFLNEPWTGLTIRKVDAADGHGLQGAIFELYRGTEVHPTDYLGDYQTNENGTVVIQKLEPGYYTVREAQPPFGYLLDPDHTVQTIEIKPDAVDKNMTIIFRNPPKPKIPIEKIDKKTGIRLPGAVFRVAKKDSIEYMEVTTKSDGTVLLENLDEEWYTITEIRAPSGYVLDSTPRNVQAAPGKTITVSVLNSQQPDLTIRKVDEATGKGLSGAALRITKDGAKEFQDVTTGENGVIVVKNLIPGWYIVHEIKAPEGYLLDTTPQYIEVKAGEDTELIIKNRHKPTLKIIKLDATTKQPLQYATFRISIKNGKSLGDFTSDANGEIYLQDIEPNLYVVEEIKAPDGYNILTSVQEIQVDWGKEGILEFTNQPVNPLLIKKVDKKTGEPLSDATFQVAKINGEAVGEYKTGRNGYITVTGLAPGWFSVKEIKAPTGYILNGTPKKVELKLNQPAVVEFEDETLNGLHIKKIGAKTKVPLAGAKFRVSEKGGKLIGEYVTDAQGEIIIDGLEPGWMTIEEIEAPAGYLLNATPKDVEFHWNQFITVEFTNQLLSPIQIKKIDEDTGAPLAGALFRVTKTSGELIGEFTSGKDGFINISELTTGSYIVSEVNCPDGYLLDNTPKTITVKENVPTIVEFTNKRLPGLQVRKVDANTNEPLAGAKFRVEQMNGERVGDFVTNSAGFFAIPDLKAGWYTVYETQAPAGYIKDSTPQNVELKPFQTAVVEFSDKPLSGLQIRKVDDVTGLPLAGVTFNITELDGRRVGSFVTDAAGLLFVPNLKESWYVVEETKTLPGYRLDNAPRNIEMKADRLNVLEYRNQPFPYLTIKKIDSETGNPLAGVKFKIYDKDARTLGEFVTNDLGQIRLTGMEAGTYFVQETQAPEGYVLDSTMKEITLYWGKTTTIEVKNVPLATLTVKKIDSLTKKPLAGATFLLYDAKNNLIGEYITDENGLIEFPRTLKEGKYKLKETKAPEGYVLNDIVQTIEVKAGATVEFTMENEPIRGQIQILKKAADDNELTDKKKDAPLAGAVFEITDEKLTVVDTITTDKNGIATTIDLPVGKYAIREITAPDYYILDDKVFYGEIKLHKDLVKFEVLNVSCTPSVTVEKRGNVEALTGDTIRYDFSNIANTGNIPLEEFFWHDQLPTDAVRLEKLFTGTWTEKLKYRVVYRTNLKKEYRIWEDKLSTKENNELNVIDLKLAKNEYITDFKVEFGTVKPDFHEDEAPFILTTVLDDLKNETRFVNKTNVGGRVDDEWIYDKDSWVTIVYQAEPKDLPKTGFERREK